MEEWCDDAVSTRKLITVLQLNVPEVFSSSYFTAIASANGFH